MNEFSNNPSNFLAKSIIFGVNMLAKKNEYYRIRQFFLIAYLVMGFGSIVFSQYELSPDSISYYGIAQKYAQFNFADAVNAYWSPLVSWLLVPFLWLKIPILIAARIVMVIIGLFIMYFFEKIVRLYAKYKSIYIGAMVSATAFTVTYSSIFFSADTLIVLFSLILFYKTYRWESNNRYAMVVGAIGVLLYYSKAYGLPFFMLVFTLLTLQRIFISERKAGLRILRTYLISVFVFLLGVGIWVGILSMSYGYFTFGTSAKYNHSISKEEGCRHPMSYMGLIAPPNRIATSAWEDVSSIQLDDWSAFESEENMSFQLNLIRGNTMRVWGFLKHFSVLSAIIIFLSGLILVQRKKRLIEHELSRIFIMGVSIISGYLLVLVEIRYVWLLAYLLIFATIFIFNEFFDYFKPNKWVKMITGLLFVVLFIKGLYYDLEKHIFADLKYSSISKEIPVIPIGSRIATVGDLVGCMNISFLNNYQCYGDVLPINDSIAEAQLEQFEIEYLFFWKPFPNKSYMKNFSAFSDTINQELVVLKRLQ